MVLFSEVPSLPDDPILGIPALFAADERSNKINLGIGAYKTAEGHPLVLKSVRKAEQLLLEKNLYKEYLPIDGDPEFIKESLRLLFGASFPGLDLSPCFAAQTVGGASALRVGGEFLSRFANKAVFVPQPSWTNHKQIFERSGLQVGFYPYLDQKTLLLDYRGLCQAIKQMPRTSAILLHGCCHNPTGVDPTEFQWKELSNLIKEQQIIPFFDLAYQGFAEDLEKDAQAIRFFREEGHEMLVAYSYSKNFGVYGERVGFLTIAAKDALTAKNIGTQIRASIRANYSNPPIHGARIIKTILQSSVLTMEWKEELGNMRERILNMRKELVAALQAEGSQRDFSYLLYQRGLFSYSGLTSQQVQRLRDEKAIYMPLSGRINVAGLNTQIIPYVAKSIVSVLE
jgi:aspartate/tyrosine/aromatic aminotransferase